MSAIVIPQWYREENPKLAGMCDIINDALEANPNMSLLEFAKVLNQNHVEQSYKRLQMIVSKQFGNENESVIKIEE